MVSLALVAAAPGCGNCDTRESVFDLRPTGPGTAAVRVHGSTPSPTGYVDGRYLGIARSRGEDPCRLAMYLHEAEPDPDAIPLLVVDDAPPNELPDGGRLTFSTLFPGVRDGRPLVRVLDPARADRLRPLEDPYGEPLERDDDPDLGRIDVWLTFATCAEPDIDIELQIRREVCPSTARGQVRADRWWPNES